MNRIALFCTENWFCSIEGPSCYYYDETEGVYKYDICTIPLCSSPALNSDIYNLCSEAFPERFPERLGKSNPSTNRCPKSSERSDIYQLCSDSFPRKFHSEVIKEYVSSVKTHFKKFICWISILLTKFILQS